MSHTSWLRRFSRMKRALSSCAERTVSYQATSSALFCLRRRASLPIWVWWGMEVRRCTAGPTLVGPPSMRAGWTLWLTYRKFQRSSSNSTFRSNGSRQWPIIWERSSRTRIRSWIIWRLRSEFWSSKCRVMLKRRRCFNPSTKTKTTIDWHIPLH